MELASMLAGERFSDHPHSVSRPIASFLRLYNDSLDDRRRQDLYPYAAWAVGTVASPAIEVFRIARIAAWGDAMWRRRSNYSLMDRIRHRTARGTRCNHPEAIANYAVHAVREHTDETHASALALIGELIAMSANADYSPDSRATQQPMHLHSEVAGLATEGSSSRKEVW